MERRKLWLWYTLAMGTRFATAHKLLERLGSIDNVYTATRKEYMDTGLVKGNLLSALLDKSLHPAEREMWYAKKYNVSIVCREDEGYPEALRHIPQPPLVLYIRGNWFYPQDDFYISVVGTRKCTPYGEEIAHKLAFELASCGVVVVSGMAEGADSAAHRGALAAGGKTVAVLGCGVNRVYPSFNKDLMLGIMRSGAVISDYDFNMVPYPGNFPQRNRLIAGLSLGTVVVEADENSGAMITANLALECGRDVFAVPGNVGKNQSEGTNRLIKEGAKMVTCAKDILEEYNVVYGDKLIGSDSLEFEVPEKLDCDVRQTVLRILAQEPKTIDEICAGSELTLSQINGAVTMLELEGRIYQLPGKRYTTS